MHSHAEEVSVVGMIVGLGHRLFVNKINRLNTPWL